MGIVKLCIDIGHHALLTVLADIPGVLVVNLSTHHQPEVWGEDGGVQLYETIGIADAHLVAAISVPGVVTTYLSKEDGIVLEGMRVGEHKAHITVVGNEIIHWLGVDILLLAVAKLLESLDDKPIALAHLPIQIQMQVLRQSTIGHTENISGIGLTIGCARHRIGLHCQLLASISHIGIGHSVAVGAACSCQLAVGLHVLTIIDIYDARRAAHRLSNRTVAAYLDAVNLASLYIS